MYVYVMSYEIVIENEMCIHNVNGIYRFFSLSKLELVVCFYLVVVVLIRFCQFHFGVSLFVEMVTWNVRVLAYVSGIWFAFEKEMELPSLPIKWYSGDETDAGLFYLWN